MNQNLIDSLKNQANLTDAEIREFSSYLVEESYPKNTNIFKPGERCNKICFITKGVIKSFIYDKEMNEAVLNIYKENWWVADVSSFHFDQVNTKNYTTMENCKVLCIYKSDLEELFKKNHKIADFFHKMALKHVDSLQEKYLNRIVMTARERYDIFINKFPDLALRIPQKVIASYLGITPEFLSKLRNTRRYEYCA